MAPSMELTTIECDVTAKPIEYQGNAMSSISINIRRFRQSVQRKPNGYETVKRHKLVSPLSNRSYIISTRLASDRKEIDGILLTLSSKSITNSYWMRKRISDLISSKAAACIKDDKVAYTVVADVDVIFEKVEMKDEILVVDDDQVRKEEKKTCAICLADLSGGRECMEMHCSHVFHRDCIWKWLRKKMSCPSCRSCICGEQTCSHATNAGPDYD